MAKVLLDTNFLMIPAQFGVDIFSEIQRTITHPEFHIVERTLKELDFIAEKGRQRQKREVKLTKELIKTQNIKIVNRDHEESVDDQLVDLAKQGYIVATQDKILKSRIKHKILTLRQKKYVVLKE